MHQVYKHRSRFPLKANNYKRLHFIHNHFQLIKNDSFNNKNCNNLWFTFTDIFNPDYAGEAASNQFARLCSSFSFPLNSTRQQVKYESIDLGLTSHLTSVHMPFPFQLNFVHDSCHNRIVSVSCAKLHKLQFMYVCCNDVGQTLQKNVVICRHFANLTE